METQLDMRRRQYFDLFEFIWQIAISQDGTVKPDEIRHKLLDLVAVHDGEREAAKANTARGRIAKLGDDLTSHSIKMKNRAARKGAGE